MAKQNNSLLTLIVVIVLALLTLLVKRCSHKEETKINRPVSTEAGDWRHHKIVYTKHARCRMDCREISESEVEMILATGVVNEEKSKEADEEAAGHCPTFALEGKTNDGQNVRIVFGACEKITKVITAIDLGVEHDCECR